MDLPLEVWIITLLYLSLNSLKDYVGKGYLLKAKEIIMEKLYCSVLPFYIWNHLFLYKHSQYMYDRCKFCTKLFIKNKKISNHVNKKLFVAIGQFPPPIRDGILITEKVYLFTRTNVFIKNDLLGVNFGLLYYESISSPFLLWKFYLDILSCVVLYVYEKSVSPFLISGVNLNCREYTPQNCSGLKRKKIRAIFYKRLVEFSLNLAHVSCENVDPNFIFDVYQSYQRGRDYFSSFLEFDRNE